MTEIDEETKMFLLESYEILDRCEEQLLKLEREPQALDPIADIFRAIHTIKGNAGFLGFTNLESLSHNCEALLDGLRAKTLNFNSEIGSVLLETVDCIRSLLQQIEKTGFEPDAALNDLSAKLNSFR